MYHHPSLNTSSSAAGLLHPDPAGVDYVGADRKTPRSQQKSSHVGAARTNPVKPAVFYWEAAQTEGGHSFTPHLLSNRKVMSDDPFSILQHAEVVFFLWKTTFSQESNTSPSFGHVRKLHHPFICCYQRYSII